MLSCTEEKNQGGNPRIIKETEEKIGLAVKDKKSICFTADNIKQEKNHLHNGDVKRFQNIKGDVYEKYCELKPKPLALRFTIHKTLHSSDDLQYNITKSAVKINSQKPDISKTQKSQINSDSDPKLCLPYSVFIGKKVNAPSSELINAIEPTSSKKERNISKRIRSKLKKRNLISHYKSDSSDDEIKKHPNRRLEMERPENLKPKPSAFFRLGTIGEKFQNSKVVNNCTEPFNIPRPDVVKPLQNHKNFKTETIDFSRLQLEEKNKLEILEQTNNLTKTLNCLELDETRQQNLETNNSKTTVFSRLGERKRKRTNSSTNNARKASKMWVDVINTPDLWKTEDYWTRCTITESEEEYDDMLEDFVIYGLKDKLFVEDETTYELRFKEKLRDTDYLHLIEEFHISPAKVEVFYQKLTDNHSAEESLKQVCLAQEWPQPTYTQIHQPNNSYGFLFSCSLKCKSFIPTRLASNSQLAKDLAASLCLDWLGVTPRRGPYGFTEETFFN